jgi:hypothetical protein
VRKTAPVALAAATLLGALAATAPAHASSGPRLISDNGSRWECRWSATYPAFPGAEPLTTALRKAVTDRRKAFLDGATPTLCPEGRRLTIRHRVLTASGDVIGVRLTTRVDAAGDGTSTRTYWYDGSKRRVGNTRLLRDGSAARLATLAKRRLAEREGIDLRQLDAAFRAPTTGLTDLSFTRTGALRLHFDRGAVAVPPAGAVEVTIGASTVRPLLSDFGRRAQRRSTRS